MKPILFIAMMLYTALSVPSQWDGSDEWITGDYRYMGAPCTTKTDLREHECVVNLKSVEGKRRKMVKMFWRGR